MRKLLFKNLTSEDHKKRDIIAQETIEKDGVLAKTTRRCLYFIKDRIRITDPSYLKKIAGVEVGDEKDVRHFYILKERDSNLGVDKLMCKVAGTFYAMINEYLYCIVFIHTFKISFVTTEEKE